MKSRLLWCLVMVIATFLAGCSDGGDKKTDEAAQDGMESGTPVVYVVNYPLQYFAMRIAGDFADVQYPAPADIDPAFWKPGAGTVYVGDNNGLTCNFNNDGTTTSTINLQGGTIDASDSLMNLYSQRLVCQ